MEYLGLGPANGSPRSSPRWGSTRRLTRRATSGSPSPVAPTRRFSSAATSTPSPTEGWLDGALNVVAGVEVLRRLADEGQPPVTVRLAPRRTRRAPASGEASSARARLRARCRTRRHALRPPRRRRKSPSLTPSRATGSISTEQSARAGSWRTRLPTSSSTSSKGRCSKRLDLPLGVVLGTFGVERHQITFRGQAAHAAGSTPMNKRRDALAAAAKLALEIREIAKRTGDGAVCTMGSCVTRPGIVTSVVETCIVLLDQLPTSSMRSSSQPCSGRPLGGERALRGRRGRRGRVGEGLEHLEPILFDTELIELADEAVLEVAGQSHRLPSGPLHDAAEVARAGIPTVMLFVQSLRGLSHTKLEDTEAGAPRAVRRGARPAREQDHRQADGLVALTGTGDREAVRGAEGPKRPCPAQTPDKPGTGMTPNSHRFLLTWPASQGGMRLAGGREGFLQCRCGPPRRGAPPRGRRAHGAARAPPGPGAGGGAERDGRLIRSSGAVK